MKKFIVLFIIFLFIAGYSTHSVFASPFGCTVTKVGNPQGPSPTLPPQCESSNVDCSGLSGSECAFTFIVNPYTLCQHYSGIYPPGHEGVDLCSPANTPIKALEDGVVVESYPDYGCGNIVKLYDPKQKRFSLHCHMIEAGLAKNTPVTRGMVIGHVGHTGANTSTTDHLHYQITEPTTNQYASGINPETVLANWPNY